MKSLKKSLLATVFALPLLVASEGFTQERNTSNDRDLNLRAYVELLRADVRAKRVAIITEIMQFSDADAAVFWPIFREYDNDLSKIGDGRVDLIQDYIENYDNISNEKADELMTKAFQLEAQRAALKKKYFDKMAGALSPRTAARFFQVENQLQQIVDLQVSANLPAMR